MYSVCGFVNDCSPSSYKDESFKSISSQIPFASWGLKRWAHVKAISFVRIFHYCTTRRCLVDSLKNGSERWVIWIWIREFCFEFVIELKESADTHTPAASTLNAVIVSISSSRSRISGCMRGLIFIEIKRKISAQSRISPTDKPFQVTVWSSHLWAASALSSRLNIAKCYFLRKSHWPRQEMWNISPTSFISVINKIFEWSSIIFRVKVWVRLSSIM